MLSVIEDKIAVVAEAADAAAAKQAQRTAQLEAVKQQLKAEQESRSNQVSLEHCKSQTHGSDIAWDCFQACTIQAISHPRCTRVSIRL